jgi:hypothetical protein
MNASISGSLTHVAGSIKTLLNVEVFPAPLLITCIPGGKGAPREIDEASTERIFIVLLRFLCTTDFEYLSATSALGSFDSSDSAI